MTSAKALAKRIVGIRAKNGFTYDQLVTYLNDNKIYTITGKPWTVANVTQFVAGYNGAATNTKVVKTGAAARRTTSSMKTSTSARFTGSWDKVAYVIASPNATIDQRFDALKYFVNHI